MNKLYIRYTDSIYITYNTSQHTIDNAYADYIISIVNIGLDISFTPKPQRLELRNDKQQTIELKTY